MRLLTAIILAVAALVGIGYVYPGTDRAQELAVNPQQITLAGNGRSTTTISIAGANAAIEVIEGARRVAVERTNSVRGKTEATIRAGVLPGNAALEITAPRFKPVRVAVTIVADNVDSFNDGTPDYLRLAGQDHDAFRQAFALLAEGAYATPASRRSREIVDCAALLRFAYREALREHDGAWAGSVGLDILPAFPGIESYHYPYTPLGPRIFRVTDGAFAAGDAAAGVFAEFADAETLRQFNTHFVSRDLRAARHGDLLFYRQDSRRMPDHAMIYLEHSQFESAGGPWAVYHTGPSESGAGEMRRPSIADLASHPEARWRPVIANNSFLGVYRWNILR